MSARLRSPTQPGGGTTFTVRLPLHHIAPDERAEALNRRAPEGLRVLIIEDEPQILDTLREILIRQGHRVDTAVDGWRGLEMALKHDYNIVLSDIRMPYLDGLGLYQALQRKRPKMIKRLAFITGDTLAAEIQSFIADTRLPYLEKPFLPDDVLRLAEPDRGTRANRHRPWRITEGSLSSTTTRMFATRSGTISSFAALTCRSLATVTACERSWQAGRSRSSSWISIFPVRTGWRSPATCATSHPVGVIMLTAAGQTIDRIIGLEMGADDYVPKPFDPRELLARVKSVMRRVARATEGGRPFRRGRSRKSSEWDRARSISRRIVSMTCPASTFR